MSKVLYRFSSHWRPVGTITLAIVCLGAPIVSCNGKPYKPARPPNISKSATSIQGPDGHGVWNACESIDGQDQCHIWTAGGTLIEEGHFVPYDGGSTPQQSELMIAQQGGSNVILLKNGRYLIPAEGSGHKAGLRYLDFMTGKTKTFASQSGGK